MKTERSDVLEQLERKMREAYISGFVGAVETVLVEEEIEKDGAVYAVGHTTRYVKVFVPITDDKIQANENVSVRISNMRMVDGISAEKIG